MAVQHLKSLPSSCATTRSWRKSLDRAPGSVGTERSVSCLGLATSLMSEPLRFSCSPQTTVARLYFSSPSWWRPARWGSTKKSSSSWSRKFLPSDPPNWWPITSAPWGTPSRASTQRPSCTDAGMFYHFSFLFCLYSSFHLEVWTQKCFNWQIRIVVEPKLIKLVSQVLYGYGVILFVSLINECWLCMEME